MALLTPQTPPENPRYDWGLYRPRLMLVECHVIQRPVPTVQRLVAIVTSHLAMIWCWHCIWVVMTKLTLLFARFAGNNVMKNIISTSICYVDFIRAEMETRRADKAQMPGEVQIQPEVQIQVVERAVNLDYHLVRLWWTTTRVVTIATMETTAEWITIAMLVPILLINMLINHYSRSSTRATW